MNYPNKQERRQSRRKVVGEPKAWVQTYRLLATLECGHTKSFTRSANAYNSGDRGPSSMECYECAKTIAAKRIAADANNTES